MKLEYTEVHWVDDQPACSLRELAEASQLPEAELLELVELGVLQPLLPAGHAPPSGGDAASMAGTGIDATAAMFGGHSRATLRTVCRLREAFELDANGVSVAFALLARIESLETELRGLRARMPQSPGSLSPD